MNQGLSRALSVNGRFANAVDARVGPIVSERGKGGIDLRHGFEVEVFSHEAQGGGAGSLITSGIDEDAGLGISSVGSSGGGIGKGGEALGEDFERNVLTFR